MKKLGLLSAACILGTSIFASSVSVEKVGDPKNLPLEGTVVPQRIDSAGVQ